MRPQRQQRNTKSAGVDLAFHRGEPRMEAPHEANRDQFPHAAAPLRGHDVLAVFDRGREWLLTEHRLADLDALQDLTGVRAVMAGDDDGVHPRTSDELLIAGDHLGAEVIRSEER